MLRLFCISNFAVLINLQNVDEYRECFFHCAWLDKDGGIINAFKKWMTNRAIRDPIGELSNGTSN